MQVAPEPSAAVRLRHRGAAQNSCCALTSNPREPLMLADASPLEHPVRQFNGMLYVNDVDAVFKTSVAINGCTRCWFRAYYSTPVAANAASAAGVVM